MHEAADATPRGETVAQSIVEAFPGYPGHTIFCEVEEVDRGVSVTVNYKGTSIAIPGDGVFTAAWPLAGDWVQVMAQGTDRFITGIRLEAGTWTPVIQMGLDEDWVTISDGTDPTYDGEYQRCGEMVEGWSKVRLPDDTGYAFGGFFSQSIPVKAHLGLGDGTATVIGSGTIGHGSALLGQHDPINAHAGRVGDLANGNYAWFIGPVDNPGFGIYKNVLGALDPFGAGSSSYGSDASFDFHILWQYRAAADALA